MLARSLAWGGAAQPGENVRSEAAALIDSLSDDELARRLDAAVDLAGSEIYLDHFIEAGAHAERAVAVGRETGQGQLFPGVFATLGVAWCAVGRLAEAAELLDAAIEAARLSGAPGGSRGFSSVARSSLSQPAMRRSQSPQPKKVSTSPSTPARA